MQSTTTRRAGGLNFSAESGERQKHLGAFIGALATGGKAPGLYGKKTTQQQSCTKNKIYVHHLFISKSSMPGGLEDFSFSSSQRKAKKTKLSARSASRRSAASGR